MNRIQQIWHKITEIGVDEQTLGREVVKVRLLNQLIVIAFSVSVINVPMYLIFGDPTGLLWSNLGNVILETATIYCAYTRRHKYARFIAVFAFSTLMAVHVIFHALNLGSVFTTLSIMGFILYEGHRRIQFTAIAYSCFLFIASKLYVINHYDNTFQLHNYNELIFFPVVLTALGLMLYIYQRELGKYEARQNVLIQNLGDKNEELSQINKELERFTYIASHDLKTPLRSISSHLDLIKIHLDKDEKSAVYEDIKYAKIGTKQMYALISDILEYKEINNIKTPSMILDLNHIVVESLEQLDKKLKMDNVQVINNGLPKIKGRKQEFSLLIKNLIENGIKYNTSETPKVQIHSEVDSDKISIFFKDNGIGIAPKYHKKIFELFKRLHRHEEYEGTGVGLGLCQKIVQRYNGQIALQSEEGKGSTFLIELPIDLLNP